MDHCSRSFLFVMLLLALLASPARAQPGDEIPSAAHFIATDAFYTGDYRDAERALRRETQRGVRVGQTRWIDAICYHAMLGEVLYHEGRNDDALANFDEACSLFLVNSDWLLQVKFQQPPRPDPNRGRRLPPWGQSQRQFVLGQFPASDQVLVGDLNAADTIQQGGVFRQPMYWRVNVNEIMRMTALAIRRRNEILGPLGKHDAISRQLSDALARGNLSPANHWSGTWINLLRGLAQVGVGKFNEAEQLLDRSIVIEGQYDHPLTGVAFLEMGRIAMLRGDGQRAAQLLAEAGFAAFYYEDWGVLTESMTLGWLNHIASGAPGVFPPLERVAAWAQANRFQHIATKMRLAQAESLLWLGQLDVASALLEDASRRLGQMKNGLAGIHFLYVQAAAQMLRGKVGPGSELLNDAITAQANVSLRNLQIGRSNQLYDSGGLSTRIAVDLYALLLADPTPLEWVLQPLDAMAVLRTPHDGSFDRWFVAALERKEAPLALEIAEQSKRRRYLAALPLGGRITALRAILEGPQSQLSRDGVVQRQQLQASVPAYRALADAGQKIQEQLRASPIVPADPAEKKKLSALYVDWEKNAGGRQVLLSQLVVRRMPTSLEFPPRLSAKQLQQSLPDGEALVVFHAAAGGLYGFLITNKDVVIWQLPDARRLRVDISALLQAIGNFGPTRQLSVVELSNEKWREAATKIFTAIFADSRIDPSSTTSLVIVPDDVLWYLPFETLMPDPKNADGLLADRLLVRYGPTAALAVSNPQPLRRPQRTGIVATAKPGDKDPLPTPEMLDELTKVVSGPVRLSAPMDEPARFVRPLLDSLISFDEVDTAAANTNIGLPTSKSRNSIGDAMYATFGLPFGGPERMVLTGFATAAEQGLKGSRRGGTRGARPGDELFHALCNVMADGTRTILLTRWRTGGRTNFELVREFAQELPNVPANEAWQRACLLAREAPLEAAREPRLKKADNTEELPTADHPFFWAGYVLVDTSPNAALEEPADEEAPLKPGDAKAGDGTPDKAEAKPAAPADEKPLPPPADPAGAPAPEPDAPAAEPEDASAGEEQDSSPPVQR